jgi:catalase
MRSIGMRLGALSAFVSLALCGSTLAAIAQQPTPTDLVDALNGVFGKHAGDRAARTKGVCLTGSFNPSAEAPKLSKAAHFAKQVPIRARFSLGGGNPNAPDNAQDNVRGLAVKFDLGNGASTDIVTILAPVFFVRTPELFVVAKKGSASTRIAAPIAIGAMAKMTKIKSTTCSIWTPLLVLLD